MIFDDGYFIAVGLLTQKGCAEIAERLAEIGNDSAGSRCLLSLPWCRDLAAQLRDRLALALPEAASSVAVQCTYFHKTAERNWSVPWHQDRAIAVAGRTDHPALSGWSVKEGMTFVNAPDALLGRMFAVRLQLDPSTPGNGPLRVIPGSHNTGTLAKSQIDAAVATRDSETCPVPRGGALVMRPLLLHASSKLTDDSPRRILHFWFGPYDPGFGLQWRVTA